MARQAFISPQRRSRYRGPNGNAGSLMRFLCLVPGFVRVLWQVRHNVLHNSCGVRVTHLLAIPLLTAPAATLRINDAGSGATAAFVVLHKKSQLQRKNKVNDCQWEAKPAHGLRPFVNGCVEVAQIGFVLKSPRIWEVSRRYSSILRFQQVWGRYAPLTTHRMLHGPMPCAHK